MVILHYPIFEKHVVKPRVQVAQSAEGLFGGLSLVKEIFQIVQQLGN